MWTRLVAGAAAHDLNNLAQGLFNLLALSSAPGTSREALERYAALARDGLKDLRKLGGDLRALADAHPDAKPARLELALGEAVTETETPAGRVVEVAPSDAAVPVRGTGAGLRLALKAVLRYAVLASAPGGVVRVSLAVEAASATVAVVADTAPAPHTPVEAALESLLTGEERDFGGDAGLVLAGAATHLQGGRIVAGPSPAGGVRFKLTFARAEEGPEHAGHA